MAHYSRRDFLKTGLAAAALAGAGGLPLRAARETATDWVTLGKSSVKVTRLAFGTGSMSGRVQRELGQDQFTRLVRYAYDRGIRFFETAESYGDMHRMLGVALNGIPRDSYRLMSKVTTHEGTDPIQKIDELRKLANTEYFDVMLLHWQHSATWPTDSIRWQDGILEAQARHAVVGHGASVHGLPALRQCPENQWLQVAMIRMNQKGTKMDAEDYLTERLGNVSEVVTHVMQALYAPPFERILPQDQLADSRPQQFYIQRFQPKVMTKSPDCAILPRTLDEIPLWMGVWSRWLTVSGRSLALFHGMHNQCWRAPRKFQGHV